MKTYFTLLLFIITTTFSFGQSKYQDVVYLKNGSIIRGVIIEQIPNKTIKIETTDRSVFVYQMEEIDKFTKEAILENNSTYNNLGFKKGYRGIVESGYEVGVGYSGIDRLKLNVINGYQINPYFFVGVGTGVRYYTDIDQVLIPIFADFRVNFIDNKFSPYLAFDIGYSFDATNDFLGEGLLLSPTVGVDFKISDNTTMNFGIGYEMQKLYFYYYGGKYFGSFSSYENSGALSFNVGISF
ncbi:hypothetical protein NU10_07085 [Flavobacterium dauae]|uniref:hypothetical protein n=1 Tax=Flavobacterium dauae TaxID=1563479 RepID=UPI00101B4F56|nr:hypothetical protein [Flavobacterium dauae]WLD25125.1 hypothetical protein NU10_07085 [Flavobacterium dauae]